MRFGSSGRTRTYNPSVNSRGVPEVLVDGVPTLPADREAWGITVHLSCVLVAARVPERLGGGRVRDPLPDHLGQEHLRVGLRPLQVPARAHVLCPCRGPEGLLVRQQ